MEIDGMLKKGGSKVLLFAVLAAVALSACGKGDKGGLSGPAGTEGQETAEGQQETAAPEPPAYPEQVQAYQEKAELLKERAMEDWVRQELGLSPAGEAGHAVFLSVCDTTKRASVFTGTGETLEEAWEAADTRARTAVGASGLEPVWVKADVTYLSEPIGTEELEDALQGSRPGYFRYGVAFDPAFETALLEAELNSAGIYVYGEDQADEGAEPEAGGRSEGADAETETSGRTEGADAEPEADGRTEGAGAESEADEKTKGPAGIDLEVLDAYLEESGRKSLGALPQECTVFQCVGWICEESSGAGQAEQADADQSEAEQSGDGQEYEVWQLSGSGSSYGGRQIQLVDDECAGEMIQSASAFLAGQVQEDGSIVQGCYPGLDQEIQDDNMVRHASAVWSLLGCYQLEPEPEPELAERIDRAVEYMLDRVVYDQEGWAYLYEEKDDEIKLGGSALAVVALTEYMEAFQNETYVEVCKALGEGILSQQDQETGAYYHVLNSDFTQKEETRTVYYDGEATFALCRLYGLTEEERWLEGARRAIDHFIQEDYTQYIDHWVAYSVNEFTKYRPDDTEAYVFAMRNALENLDKIYRQETACPTYLELLMAAFETYERMQENGMIVGDDAREMLLKVIYARADRMRTGYLYPEYAMYMADPQKVLGAFMVRHQDFRVRIDDIQHAVGGYGLYLEDYDRLVACGLLEAG